MQSKGEAVIEKRPRDGRETFVAGTFQMFRSPARIGAVRGDTRFRRRAESGCVNGQVRGGLVSAAREGSEGR